MAITKVLASSALVIEVENGSDKNGAPTYRKKSFAGVKGNAAVENVYAVADAIKAVMKNPTRNYYLNDSNLLDNDQA